MDTSVTRLRDIFLNEKKLPKRELFAVFDRAGVPSDTCWRTLYRMIFDSKISYNPIAEKAVSRQQLIPVMNQALKTVAKNITLACSEESERNGIVYHPVRYGGEEFVVIIPAVDITEAKKASERVREKIKGYTFVIRGKQGSIKHENIKLTVSVGVAGFSHQEGKNDGVEELIKNADQAMFAAKKSGKNRVMARYQ